MSNWASSLGTRTRLQQLIAGTEVTMQSPGHWQERSAQSKALGGVIWIFTGFHTAWKPEGYVDSEPHEMRNSKWSAAMKKNWEELHQIVMSNVAHELSVCSGGKHFITRRGRKTDRYRRRLPKIDFDAHTRTPHKKSQTWTRDLQYLKQGNIEGPLNDQSSEGLAIRKLFYTRNVPWWSEGQNFSNSG